MKTIPFADYLTLPAVNWSTLKHLRKSPLHYRHALENPREDNARLALGRAAHTAVFEPDKFMLEYACFKGERRAGKAWEAFKEQHAGETILKIEEYRTCLAIRDAVRRHPVAAEYLAAGVPESSIFWTDLETGLECKARPDWISVSKGALVDLKTTGDIDAHRFAATAARMLYYCQLAFYREGLKRAHDAEYPVVMIAVEQSPPHDVAVYTLDEDALYAGWEEVQVLLVRLKRCRNENRWPGRYEEAQTLRLPGWIWPDEESDTAIGDDLVFGPATGG